MPKYVDDAGLARFWDNIKKYDVPSFPNNVLATLTKTDVSFTNLGMVQGGCVDGSGNMYIFFTTSGNPILAKFDSSGNLISQATVNYATAHGNSLVYDDVHDNVIVVDQSTNKLYYYTNTLSYISSQSNGAVPFSAAAIDFANDRAIFFMGTTSNFVICSVYDDKVPVSQIFGTVIPKNEIYLQDACAVPSKSVFCRLLSGNFNWSGIEVIGYAGAYLGTIWFESDVELQGMWSDSSYIYLIGVDCNVYTIPVNTIDAFTEGKNAAQSAYVPELCLESHVVSDTMISGTNANSSTSYLRVPTRIYVPLAYSNTYQKVQFGMQMFGYNANTKLEAYFAASNMRMRLLINGLFIYFYFTRDSSDTNLQNLNAVEIANAVSGTRAYISYDSSFETKIQAQIAQMNNWQLPTSSYSFYAPATTNRQYIFERNFDFAQSL